MQAELNDTQHKLPTQKQHSNSPQLQKNVQQTVLEQAEQSSAKKVCLTLRVKIIIGILCLIIGVGIGVGLYFRFRPNLEQKGEITWVNLGNGGYYAVGEFQLTDRNIFENDTDIKLILTHAAEFGTKKNSRLLEEDINNPKSSEYSIHANLEQGFQLSFSSTDEMTVRVNPETLLNYLVSTEPEAARLLAEVKDEKDVNDTEIVQELQVELSKAFNDELNINASSFEFKPVEVVEFVHNHSTSSYDLANGTQSHNATRRMLTIRSLRSLKKFFKSLGRVIRNIVRPIVNVIRKSAPLIGKVAGAIVGGVLGGPVGAVAGYQIGQKIGTAAQVLVTACVPENKITIRCTKDQVKEAGKIVMKQVVGQVVGGMAGSVFKMVNPSQSKSMVLQAVSKSTGMFMR